MNLTDQAFEHLKAQAMRDLDAPLVASLNCTFVITREEWSAMRNDDERRALLRWRIYRRLSAALQEVAQ